MNQEWDLERLEKNITNSSKQLLAVSTILLIFTALSFWLQQSLSWVTIVLFIFLMAVFIFVKVMQIVQWQQRINELMRRK